MAPNLARKLLGAVFTIIAASIIYFVATAVDHSRLSKVIINVAPEDSSLTMNGMALHKKSLYVKPGNYTFIASRPGFKDDSSTISVTKSKTTSVYLLPTPVTNNALQYLKDNPQVQTEREGFASAKVASTQAALLAKYPIIKYLPLNTRYYSINYGQSIKKPGDPLSLAIYITSDPANRDLALGWIKYKGFDPNKLEIIYSNQ